MKKGHVLKGKVTQADKEKVKAEGLAEHRRRRTPHNSKKGVKTAKNKSYPDLSIYMDADAVPTFPKRDEAFKNAIDNYGYDEDEFLVGDFFLHHRLHTQSFLDVVRKDEKLKRAWESCRRRIDSHQQRGAMTRKLDGTFVAKVLPMYNEEYRKVVKDEVLTEMKRMLGAVGVKDDHVKEE